MSSITSVSGVITRNPPDESQVPANPQSCCEVITRKFPPPGNYIFAIAVQKDPIVESVVCGSCLRPLEATDHPERPAACDDKCKRALSNLHPRMFRFMRDVPTGNRVSRMLVETAARRIGSLSAEEAMRVKMIVLSGHDAHLGKLPEVDLFTAEEAEFVMTNNPGDVALSSFRKMRHKGSATKSVLFAYQNEFGGTAWTEVYLERPATYCDGCQQFGDKDALQCGTCKRVRYCSRKCQKKAWPEHKSQCVAPLLPFTREAATALAEELMGPVPMKEAPKSDPIDEAHKCAECGFLSAGAALCAGCHEVYYCDDECQNVHWRDHKAACRAAARRLEEK